MMRREFMCLLIVVFLQVSYSVALAERKGVRIPLESRHTSYYMSIP